MEVLAFQSVGGPSSTVHEQLDFEHWFAVRRYSFKKRKKFQRKENNNPSPLLAMKKKWRKRGKDKCFGLDQDDNLEYSPPSCNSEGDGDESSSKIQMKSLVTGSWRRSDLLFIDSSYFARLV